MTKRTNGYLTLDEVVDTIDQGVLNPEEDSECLEDKDFELLLIA